MNIKWGSSPSINEHLRSKSIGSDFETVRGTISKPDHLVVIQGQVGGRDPYASITCTPETLSVLTGGAPSIKVASLGDLSGFLRVSSNLLIHKSTSDLWNVTKTADGAFEVSRLFDDDGSPLKG